MLDKGLEDSDDRTVDLSELNPAQRIHHLERSIMFLKQQHAEVLKSLHEEIDGLKKENKGTFVFHLNSKITELSFLPTWQGLTRNSGE